MRSDHQYLVIGTLVATNGHTTDTAPHMARDAVNVESLATSRVLARVWQVIRGSKVKTPL